MVLLLLLILQGGCSNILEFQNSDGILSFENGVLMLASDSPPISAGDIVAAVRVASIVGPQTIAQAPVIGKVLSEAKALSGANQEEAMKAFLMYERFVRKDDSRLASYWTTLPQTFNTPILWKRSNVALLEGSQLFEHVAREKSRLRAAFAVLRDGLFTHVDLQEYTFTLKNYVWAHNVFTSRSREVPGIDGRVILPLLDAVQCDEKMENSHLAAPTYDKGLKAVVVRAPSALHPGEVVRGTCGNYSNYDSLLYRGEVTEYPANDCVNVAFHYQYGPGDGIDDWSHQKMALLNGVGFPSGWVACVHGRTYPREVMLYACIVACPTPEFERLREKVGSWEEANMRLLRSFPFSKYTRRQARFYLRTVLSAKLAGYATSMDEDMRLLEEGGLSDRRSLATQFVLEEKRTLTRRMSARMPRKSKP